MTRIVAIDDEPAILQAMADYLEHFGYEMLVHAYMGPGEQGFAEFRDSLTTPPDLIIADYRLPGELTGIEIVDDLREKFGSETPAILFTGDVSKTAVGEAENKGLTLLFKPVRMEKLRSTIDKILQENSSN